MSPSPPRVVIVSVNPLRSDQPNGILMRSLFAGWPHGRLAQVHFPLAVWREPDRATCSEHVAIPLWGPPLRLPEHAAEQSVGSSPRRGLAAKLAGFVQQRSSLLRLAKPAFEAAYTLGPHTGRLAAELRRLRPDCVYALVGSWWSARVFHGACRAAGVPMMLHVTDDFVSGYRLGAALGGRQAALAEAALGAASRYAVRCAAIGPEMAEAFSRRYGGDWDWFTTLVDSADYDATPPAPSGAVRFVYAGGLRLERSRTLAHVANAIVQLRAEGMAAELVVYAPDEEMRRWGAEIGCPPVVRLAGWTEPSRLPAIFAESDVLVHAESFAPTISAYTALSFSTKLSQYLMAGRPILAVGPEEHSALATLEASGGAVAVRGKDPQSLLAAVRRLAIDAPDRAAMGGEARRWAMRWVESEAGRRRFAERLAETARSAPRARAA